MVKKKTEFCTKERSHVKGNTKLLQNSKHTEENQDIKQTIRDNVAMSSLLLSNYQLFIFVTKCFALNATCSRNILFLTTMFLTLCAWYFFSLFALPLEFFATIQSLSLSNCPS